MGLFGTAGEVHRRPDAASKQWGHRHVTWVTGRGDSEPHGGSPETRGSQAIYRPWKAGRAFRFQLFAARCL